jgi:hypothetical protein
MIAALLALISQAVALGEPIAGGRPVAAHLAYVTSLTAIAALISLLNARRPGSGAWALLMTMLVVVFQIPWLEGFALSARVDAMSRLRLEMPWSIFYVLLTVTGLANLLPTRSAPGVMAVALAFLILFLALQNEGIPTPLRALAWTAFPLLLAIGVCVSGMRLNEPAAGGCRLERLWRWFRDRWGVVWALRVQDRFEREARLAGWPLTLSWHGIAARGSGESPDRQEEGVLAHGLRTLKALLHRFAEPEVLERAASEGSGRDPA